MERRAWPTSVRQPPPPYHSLLSRKRLGPHRTSQEREQRRRKMELGTTRVRRGNVVAAPRYCKSVVFQSASTLSSTSANKPRECFKHHRPRGGSNRTKRSCSEDYPSIRDGVGDTGSK